MSDNSKQYKTVILNGTRLWGIAVMFLVTNLAVGTWHASRFHSTQKQIVATVSTLIEKVDTLSERVVENKTNVSGLLDRERVRNHGG